MEKEFGGYDDDPGVVETRDDVRREPGEHFLQLVEAFVWKGPSRGGCINMDLQIFYSFKYFIVSSNALKKVSVVAIQKILTFKRF